MLTAEQLEMRRTGITGTDIGAICGLSELRSPLDVWLEKMGKNAPLDLTPALERGIYLEDGILRWYEARAGALKVKRCGTIQLAGEPRIMATPDGVAMFSDKTVPPDVLRILGENMTLSADIYDVERRGVEVKAPGRFMETGWGEPGTDQVPQGYLAQAVFEMAVLDVERLDFAALLGGELKVYPVFRNRDVERLLIDRALAFWRDHVETGKAPDPTWRERDQEWIKASFPKATRPAISWDSLTPAQQSTVQDFLLHHERAAKLEHDVTELELRVKLIVGDAGGITDLPAGLAATRYTRIDWKENGSGSPAWKKIAESLKAGTAWDAAVTSNTGASSRPFCPRKSKKGDE